MASEWPQALSLGIAPRPPSPVTAAPHPPPSPSSLTLTPHCNLQITTFHTFHTFASFTSRAHDFTFPSLPESDLRGNLVRLNYQPFLSLKQAAGILTG